MFKRLLAVLLLLPSLAFGQSVQQSGTITPGHLSSWVTTGVIKDAGTASNPQVNALGMYGSGGIPFAINSTATPGVSSAQYCEVGLGTSNAAGATLYSFGQNGLTNCPLSFNINGSVYHFPFATGGNVVGPASSTVGSPAIWNNTSGTLLANSVGYLPNVIDNCGAKGDGSTADDAAFATCNLTYKEYAVPYTANGYRIANAGGLVIPAGVRIDGIGFEPGNPNSGATIVCDLTVTPCISLTAGNNGTASMTGIIQTRAAGSVPSGSIGILINEGYNIILSRVMVLRDAIGYDLKACSADGISFFGDNLYSGTISDAHIVIDGWPEAHFSHDRFGMDGNGDVNANAYVRVKGPSCGTYIAGSGPNTLHFDDVHFNLGQNNVTYGYQFVNLVSGSAQTVEYYLNDVHFEGVATADFYTDSSWTTLNKLQVVNTVSNDSAPTFALNAATMLNQVHFANTYFGGTFSLPASGNIGDLDVTNSYLGAITIVGGSGNASFSNTTASTFTISGVFGTFSYLGGALYGTTYTNNATGNILIATPGNPLVGFAGGGSTSPGGSSGNVQYNNSSSFGGASYLNVSGSAPQLALNQTNSGGNTTFQVTNGATASSNQAILEAVTGTPNAYITVTQADGSALEGVIGTGSGDANGLTITTLAGPLTLSPYTTINIPYMTGSKPVCTDGSKNLTTTGCSTSGVVWPTTGDIVVSNGSSSPAGLAESDGDCVVGAGGVWTAGSCSGSAAVSSVTGTSGQVTVSPTTGNVIVSLPSTITQNTIFSGTLENAHSNSGGNTVFETLNNNTANSTQAIVEVTTGTSNAYMTFTQADGATLAGVIGTGAGDTNGMTITTLAGPINLTPYTNVNVTSGDLNISGLTASVPVCTDSSKNLTSSCTTITGAGPVGTASSVPVFTYDNYGRLTTVTTASIAAPAGALTGTTLASGVTASSLTSLGTISTLNFTTAVQGSGGSITNGSSQVMIQDNGNTIIGNGSEGIYVQNTVRPGTSSSFDLGDGTHVFNNLYANIYYVGATAGASCPSGINATTFVSVNGIVTHC